MKVGCSGCKHCTPMIVDKDCVGYTCTCTDFKIQGYYPLPDRMVYGYSINISMDGNDTAVMDKEPPICKKERS